VISHNDDLIRRFYAIRAAILGYLRVLVRDLHLAEDLFQETCLVVMKKLETYDRTRDFDAWVRGIAHNLARNALRKEQHLHLVSSPELVAAIERTHESAASEETGESAAQLEYLHDCLGHIEPRLRKLLELRYRTGASLRYLARETGRSSGAVQVALSRARHFLLRCVEQRRSVVSHG